MRMNLMKGDCLEMMKLIPDGSVDCVVTSPPYGIGKSYEKRSSLSDYLEWHGQVVKALIPKLSEDSRVCWQVGNFIDAGCVYPLDCLVFGQFLEEGLLPRNRIVWHFGHGLHASNRFSGRHEVVLVFSKGSPAFHLDPVRIPQKYPGKRHYKGPKKGELSGNPLGKNPGDVWDIPNVKNNHPEKTEHPCQFPEALVERLLRSMTREGDTVLDPFLGSGTTGVAAVNTGRKIIGIERDDKYFAIAQKRIEDAMYGDLI